MNYYELLEVNPNASAEVIKNAYKTLAKKFHPDTYDGDRVFAEEKMKLLNEAISVLENEEKRKAYNEENNIGTYYNSYSTVFSSPDLSDTFMEDIDNFLSKKTKTVKKDNKENTVKKAKKKIIIEEEADDDDADNIANITDLDDAETLTETETESKSVYAQSKYDDDIQNSLKKVGYYDEDDDEYEEDDEDDDYDEDDDEGYRSRKKNKVKVGKWYWIAISALAVGIIVVGILIFQAFNLDNIRGLFPNSPLNSGVNNIHDDSDDEEHEDEIIPEAGDDEIATEPVLEMPDELLALPVAPVEGDTASPQVTLHSAAASTEATTQAPTQALTQAPTPPPIAQRPAPRPTAAPTQPPTPAPTEPTTSEEESPTEDITVSAEQEITDGTDGLIESETETEDTAGNDTTPDESESQAEENIGSEEMPEEPVPEPPVIVEHENEVDIPEH